MAAQNFCIGVVSRAQVKIGVKRGFLRIDRGKQAPLKRLRSGLRCPLPDLSITSML